MSKEIQSDGFIKHTEGLPESTQDVNTKLFDHYNGIAQENQHPNFSKQPADVFYWHGHRLETVKQGLAEIF